MSQVIARFVVLVKENSPDVMSSRISRIERLVSEDLDDLLVKVDFAIEGGGSEFLCDYERA